MTDKKDFDIKEYMGITGEELKILYFDTFKYILLEDTKTATLEKLFPELTTFQIGKILLYTFHIRKLTKE